MIEDDDHPAKGGFGVFATKLIEKDQLSLWPLIEQQRHKPIKEETVGADRKKTSHEVHDFSPHGPCKKLFKNFSS
jgi:hypothetical protein